MTATITHIGTLDNDITPTRPLTDYVREALGIDAGDARVRIQIDGCDDWMHSWCAESSPAQPAAVTIEYCTWDPDDMSFAPTDITLAADIAGSRVNWLAVSDHTDPHETILVKVSAQWVRFARPDLAALL